MRILLTVAPEIRAALFPMSKVQLMGAKYPPLGVLYLAATLRQTADHELRLVDAWDFRSSTREIEPLLRSWQPEVVGISATTFVFGRVVELADLAKAVNPAVHVTIGGYHNYFFPAETLARPSVDSVVIGEGESTFAELIDALAHGRSLAGIAGLGYKVDGRRQWNEPRAPLQELDRLPFPARDLLSPGQVYTYSADSDVKTATILSSRGCPYHCVFCSAAERYYHTRSPENVLAEMVACRREGYRQFNFVDESFNLDLARVKRLCDLLIEEKLDATWTFRGRVDRFDEELAEKLSRARCTRINFGLESGSDRVLQTIPKGATTADGRRVFTLCRKYRLPTVGYFIVGLPGETDEEVGQTVRYAMELRTDFAQFNSPYLIPGSPLYARAIDEGVLDADYYRAFVRNPSGVIAVPVYLGRRTAAQVQALVSGAYRRFYLRPSYLLARLRELRSAREFWKKFKIGLALIWYVARRRSA